MGGCFTSTPETCCPAPSAPGLPYVKSLTKRCQTPHFGSYGCARDSLPPRFGIEPAAAELQLCHQISDSSAAVGVLRSPVGCSPAEPYTPASHHSPVMKTGPSVLPPVSRDDSALLNSNKQQINPHSSFVSLETSTGGGDLFN